VILTCAACGVNTGRREGLTGVWAGHKKIASIGVGVKRWVAMHGLALNVGNSSLEAFQHITPCGISNVEMTSLEMESGNPQSVEKTGCVLADLFLRELPGLQP
jgi:lipoyl(octanoyl) transferase